MSLCRCFVFIVSPTVSVEANYPFNFFGKADTDRTLSAFARFRSVVLFPHDFALMTFYEFLGRMTFSCC